MKNTGMGNAPALCAKVRAMYGKRLREEDYRRMMNLSEVGLIASFLREHPGYSQGLSSIGEGEIHREQLEDLLREQKVYDYSKLICHTAYTDKRLMGFFVRLSDIEIILSQIRRLNAGDLATYHVSVPLPLDEHSEIPYRRLNDAVDLTGLLSALEGTGYQQVLMRARNEGGDGISYTDAEVGLYNLFYSELFASLKKNYTGEAAQKLAGLIGTRVDLRNIACALRMRRYYSIKPEDIYSLLISHFMAIPSGLPAEIIAAADDAEVLALIASTPYGSRLGDCGVSDIDGRIDGILAEEYRKTIRTAASGALCAAAYIFFKGIEIKNVTHIIECVRYSVKVSDIPRYVVGLRAAEEGGA